MTESSPCTSPRCAWGNTPTACRGAKPHALGTYDMPTPRITPALVPETSAPGSRIQGVGSEPRGLPGHSGNTPHHAAPASENGYCVNVWT